MKKRAMLVVAVSAVAFGAGSAASAQSLWTLTTGGSWTEPLNWSAGVPNAAGAVATINTDFAATPVITLDSDITVGTLALGDATTSGTNAYLGVNVTPGSLPGNRLIFDSGVVGTTAVLRRAPSTSNNTIAEVISAGMQLNSNLAVTASNGTSGGSIRLSGAISGSGGLRATGGATGVAGTAPLGTVIIGAGGIDAINSYTGPTILENGNLQFSGNARSGEDGALGNSTTAIQVGTTASSTNNSSTMTLQVNTSGPTGNNEISRGIDFSGVNTIAGTGISTLRYAADTNLASGVRSNTLTVSGPVTLASSRNVTFVANRAGMTMNFTGPISGGLAGRSLRLGGFPTNAVNTGFTELGGGSVYRFSDVARDFTVTNLFVVNGTVVIAGSVGAGDQPSPIGKNVNVNGGFNLADGNGGNIVSASGLGAIRGIFLETPGATFARDFNPGGASGSVLAVYGGVPAAGTVAATGTVAVLNGYRFGGLNTSGEVTYTRGVFPQQVQIGGPTPLITIAHNIALISETGGVVNFTGAFSQGGTPSLPGAATTTSSNTRLTFNGARNHPSLDLNGDGVPDTGGPAGTNANDVVGPIYGGTIRLSNTSGGGYVNFGTTEVMGGTLVINGNYNSDTVGDTFTVNAGATLAGFGSIRAGAAGTALNISGTVNPGDPLPTRVNTAAILTVNKPVTFKAGSTLAVDLNSGTVFGTETEPKYDRLALGTTSSLTIESGATLSVQMGFEPGVNTNFDVVTQPAANPASTGIFKDSTSLADLPNGSTLHKAYIDTLTPANSAPVDLELFYNSGVSGRNVSFVARSPVSSYALTGSGPWSDNNSWTNLAGVPYFPKSANATALFGSSIGGPSVVTLDSVITVRNVRFDSLQAYTVSGAGSITLSPTSGSVLLEAVQGDHTIATPVTFAGNATLNIAAGASLTLLGNVASTAGTLNTQIAGELFVVGASSNLGNVTGTGTLIAAGGVATVNAAAIGTLEVGAGARVNLTQSPTNTGVSVVETLVIDNDNAPLGTRIYSGFVDVANNGMVISGADGAEQATELATTRDMVRSWTTADAGLPGASGLGTSMAFYGVGDAFITLAVYNNNPQGNGTPDFTTFNGVTVDAFDTLVKYTYLGDTNLDGVVDATDLSRALTGLNGGGTGWNFGDVNYDGVVNFVDLGRIQAALRGQGAPLGNPALGGGGAIPEPGSIGFLAPLGLLLSRRRRT